MGKPVRDQKLLYHLTSINNIESIFEKGLLARSCLSDDFDDVADPDIIAKRKKMGILDKIPFHFFSQTLLMEGFRRITQQNTLFILPFGEALHEKMGFK